MPNLQVTRATAARFAAILPLIAAGALLLVTAACSNPWAPDPTPAAEAAATPPVLQSPWASPNPGAGPQTWPPFTLEATLTDTGAIPGMYLGVPPNGRYRLDFRSRDDWTITPLPGSNGPTLSHGAPQLICRPDCLPGPPSVRGLTDPLRPLMLPTQGDHVSMVSRVPGVWTFESRLPLLDATLVADYAVEYMLPVRWRLLTGDGTLAMEYRATRLELADGTSILPASLP